MITRIHFAGGATLVVLNPYKVVRDLQEGVLPAHTIPHRRDTNGHLLVAELTTRDGNPATVNWTAVAYAEPA